MGEIHTELTWRKIIARLKELGAKIEVPTKFNDQVESIDNLLSNDSTGLVKPVYDFMVGTATVPFTFVTDNNNLTNTLNNWANNELNKNIAIDIPKGLRELSSQYFRERWRSSFIVLNILWEKIDDYVLPKRIWFTDSKNITVKGEVEKLNKKEYYLGDNQFLNTENKTVIIRKPFNSWYEVYPVPYLISRGVYYNSLLKKALVQKEADILEEIIPYLLLLKAGDSNLLKANMLTNLDGNLTELKDSLKKYKRDHKYRTQEGDSILKGRYDLQLEHLIPELGKIFDEKIVKPLNWNILAGLGLIELEGFSSNRQEAILNPKILVEEIVDAVLDWTLILEDILQMIIDKNKDLHKKQMNKDIRIVPGILKAFLTESMRKIIKDYANTGQLSLQDSFEALPQGFDFAINVMRRKEEREKGYEDLFFPRVLLNQDSNTRMDVPTRQNITPNEIPKKKKEEEATSEELEAPYNNIDELPESIKNSLPIPAQIIFLKAFNSAIEQGHDEETAFKIAWVAVKTAGYKKNKAGKWILKK